MKVNFNDSGELPVENESTILSFATLNATTAAEQTIAQRYWKHNIVNRQRSYHEHAYDIRTPLGWSNRHLLDIVAATVTLNCEDCGALVTKKGVSRSRLRSLTNNIAYREPTFCENCRHK